MGRTSREKGKRGEREFATILREMGFEARRTQQFSGTEGTSDVVSNISGVHWEVKRYARIGSVRFLDQAIRDCSDHSIPAVAMREDRGEWILQLRARDLPTLAARVFDALGTSGTIRDSSSNSSSSGEGPDTSPTSPTTKS